MREPVADTEFTMNSGTDSPPRASHKPAANTAPPAIITVQPLRKSEMQPSYAQDLGLGEVNHGFYGNLINCLGGFAGSIGQFVSCNAYIIMQ
jgi:erythrocyte band 7 integral membrane protein